MLAAKLATIDTTNLNVSLDTEVCLDMFSISFDIEDISISPS